MPSGPVASRWSTERAPSSTASGIAPASVNWSPWRRSARPWSRRGFEVAAGLGRVEGAALQEDVGGLGELGRVGEHLREQEVEIRVRVRELRRRRVGAEEGRDAAGSPDRAQRGELRLAVEAVARLPLERRRPGAEHPAAVALDGLAQPLLPRLARRAHGREDPAAGRVQLLVARAAGAKRELLDAVAAERRMRVAVDEAGDRAEPTARRCPRHRCPPARARSSDRPPRSVRRRRARSRSRSPRARPALRRAAARRRPRG